MNRNSIYIIAIILISSISAITTQSLGIDKAELKQDSCVSKTSCGSCIQTQKCAWCSQPEFGDRPRCFMPDVRPAVPCPEELIVNPDNEQIFVSNSSLSKGGKQISGGGGMVSGGTYEEFQSGQSSMSGGSSASGGSSMSGGASGSSESSIVQIQPQHVALKLRVSEYRNSV